MSHQPIAFSGIQPTNILHLGNYLGAIKNWLELPNKYQCFFCIVDFHAITVKQDPKKFQEMIFNTAATYLALGIDPKKSVIFVQSQVPAHTELAWILNTVTKMAELERMTQYKDKAKQHPENINVGLFAYPVLMAADILLYQTNIVPVGEDQKQHVEIARTIAQRFNYEYDEVFTLPEAIIKKAGARIMGLDEPNEKMSKSASSPLNYIALTDEPDLIWKKISKAVTDSGKEIKAGKDKPALTNLLTIYGLLTDKSIKFLEEKYKNQGYAEFKNDLAEVIVDFLIPVQKKIKELKKDKSYVEQVLKEGKVKAQKTAEETLKKVKWAMGLL